VVIVCEVVGGQICTDVSAEEYLYSLEN
jgi:hypothetical protein